MCSPSLGFVVSSAALPAAAAAARSVTWAGREEVQGTVDTHVEMLVCAWSPTGFAPTSFLFFPAIFCQLRLISLIVFEEILDFACS